jgi:hypothetical protein
MNELQEKNERAVGESFIGWFNSENGTEYRFKGRPERAPDLIYVSGSKELYLEVTSAFYNKEHAKFIWKSARGESDAPNGWTGMNANESLVYAIHNCITKKAQKRYDKETLLLVEVPPGVTGAEELTSLLNLQKFSDNLPFIGIYIVGEFPIKKGSTGGFRVIPIQEMKAGH